MAWSPTTLLSRTRRHRHDTGPPDAIDAKETLLDVHLRLPGVGGRRKESQGPQNFLPYATWWRSDTLARPQPPPQRRNAVREGDQPRGAPGYALKRLRRSVIR